MKSVLLKRLSSAKTSTLLHPAIDSTQPSAIDVNSDPVAIDCIQWKKIFPGLHLWSAIRLSFRLRVLLPAWLMVFVSTSLRRWDISVTMLDRDFPQALHWLFDSGLPSSRFLGSPLSDAVFSLTGVLQHSTNDLAGLLLLLLCQVLLLAVGGVAIARSTSAEFCSQQRIGGPAALRFSLSHVLRPLLSLAIVVIILVLLISPLAVITWLSPALNQPTLSGSATMFWLLIAIPIAVVCWIGWLLSIAAIGTDICDGADGLSRGINYVLSRPTQVAGYLLIVLVVGKVASSIASFLVTAAFEAASGWMPELVIANIQRFRLTSIDERLAASEVPFILQFPAAVQLGAFLSGITLTYLVLRQQEDGTELRERAP
ncbi:MAG: hypothetical protein R3C49_01070 [Planctomycetaceae bacterium]